MSQYFFAHDFPQKILHILVRLSEEISGSAGMTMLLPLPKNCLEQKRCCPVGPGIDKLDYPDSSATTE